MEKRDLPKAPSFWQTLGPSFIFLGLSLGSGELIMWPYLTANFGLGIIWGALLGITFQFFMNMEITRYSLVYGESVFVGFWRLWKLWPVWFILSTFIAWGLPGFSAAGSQILGEMFGLGNETLVAIGLLLLTGVILSLGKTLYRTMEVFQKSIIVLGTPLIVILVLLLTKSVHWQAAAWGLLGKGEGYFLLPAGISLMSFLGAFAYAGAGGNLNLAQSFYVKEKGYGMGRFAQKIKSLLAKGKSRVDIEGTTFPRDAENLAEFSHWWRAVNLEHGSIFWFLGFLTIMFLAILAFALVHDTAGAHLQGIGFLFAEAKMIGGQTFALMGTIFLLMVFLMLFSTQTGVLESTSRIISENVFLLLKKEEKGKINLSQGFYLALWGQIVFGIIILLLGFREPRFLLTLAAVINAVCMFVHLGLTFVLNRQFMPKELRPAFYRVFILAIAFVFFGVFSFLTFWQGVR
jgi:hypothetical protein